MSAFEKVLVSGVWSSLSGLSRLLLAAGLIRPVRLPGRVISVGNIQAGGAGKTPLVARIAREAIERGKRVCILSRGYRSRWERSGGVIPPRSAKLEERVVSADVCGDEPALLHELVPEAWIGVGADRARSYGEAARQAGFDFDLVLLDDGFQNRQIRKDLEVVALTSASAGEAYFREWRGALKFADLLVWTKGDKQPEAWGKSLVRVRYVYPSSLDRNSGPLVLVAGVADPSLAARQVREAGFDVSECLAFEDHAEYSRERIESILSDARRDGRRVAVTGKDWVKWRNRGVKRQDVLVLEPELEIVEGKELWEKRLWAD